MIRQSVTAIYDQMIKDSKQKPPHLNMRKQAHRDIRDCISAAIIELTPLVKPFIITDKQILDVYYNYEFEWDIIESICSDLICYFKTENYIIELIDSWLDLASNLEEYECAQNIKRIKELIEQKKLEKSV